MISYPFPPITKSGTFRPAKFVKYLPQYNWQPFVITIKPKSKDPIDDSLTKDLPDGLPVVRITAWHPRPRDHFLDWLKGKRMPSSVDKPGNGNASAEGKPSILARITKFFEKLIEIPLSFIQYPPVDRSIYWSLRIIPAARKIIKKNDINVIFTTSPPFSPLVTGLVLKKIYGIPWVVDFRDPWTTEKLRYGSTGWRLKINRFIERRALQEADGVIGVTPNWVDDLKHLTGDSETSDKFFLITNGYDETDFANHAVPDVDVETEIKISHIGSIYEGGLEVLLNGMSHLDHSALSKLKVDIIGYMHPHDLDKLTQATTNGNISYQPQRLSHDQSLDLMRKSHVLLLSLPFEYYPGKLFEYMRVGRPVLALAPEGSAAELIEQTQIGCVINREDTDQLTNVLEQIAFDYEGFVERYYHPNWEFIHQFERRILTQKLSTIFTNLSPN